MLEPSAWAPNLVLTYLPWNRVSYSTSHCLRFLIYRMGIPIIFVVKMNHVNLEQCLTLGKISATCIIVTLCEGIVKLGAVGDTACCALCSLQSMTCVQITTNPSADITASVGK